MSKIVGSLKIREYLGCTESTLMQRIVNEGLPVKKVKGEYVTTTAKLEKWLGVKAEADDPDKAAKAKAAKEQAEADAAQAKADQEQAEADAANAAVGKK